MNKITGAKSNRRRSARIFLAMFCAWWLPFLSAQPAPAASKPASPSIDELVGQWKSTTKPGQSITITKGSLDAGADTVIYLSGRFHWEGKYNPATGMLTLEKLAGLSYLDLNARDIPGWAREKAAEQFEGMNYTLHMQLHAIRGPADHCPVLLVGEWGPGEVAWTENRNGFGDPDREVQAGRGDGPRQFVSYSRSGENLGGCDDLEKLIAERGATYDRVEKIKDELDTKLRQIEGDLGLSADRYATVKKYRDDYNAAVERAKKVEDIAALARLVGTAAAKSYQAMKAAEKAAQEAKALAKSAAQWTKAAANNPKLRELESLVKKFGVITPEEAMAIKADPQAMRSLKNAPKEIRVAFNNAETVVNQVHDQALLDYVRSLDKYPPSEWDPLTGTKTEWANKELVVHDFRTPGAPAGSINTDRDFRVLYKAGPNQWKEVPTKYWADKSVNIFAKSSGFSPTEIEKLASDADKAAWGKITDPTKLRQAQEEKWAQLHQQLATDKYHLEASRDFSDQQVRAGQWFQSRPDVENPGVPDYIGKANVEDVVKGNGVLEDPQRMGMMYHVKLTDAFEATSAAHPYGNSVEALAQTDKALGMLDKIRGGYEARGLDAGRLPQSLQDARDLLKDFAKTTPFDSSVTTERLQELNKKLAAILGVTAPAAGDAAETEKFTSRLVHQVADMVDGQYQSLKAVEAGPLAPLAQAMNRARQLDLTSWLGATGDPALLARLGAEGVLDWLGNPYTNLLLAGADLANVLPQGVLDSELREMVKQASKAKRELLEAEPIWLRLSDAFDAAPPVDDLRAKLKECLAKIPPDKRDCFQAISDEELNRLEAQYNRLKEYVTRIRDLRNKFDRAAMQAELRRELRIDDLERDLAKGKADYAKAKSEYDRLKAAYDRPGTYDTSFAAVTRARLAADQAEANCSDLQAQINTFNQLSDLLPKTLKFDDLAAVLDPSTNAVDQASKRVDDVQQEFDRFLKTHPGRSANDNLDPTAIAYLSGDAHRAALEMLDIKTRLNAAQENYKASISNAASVGKLAALCSALQSTVQGIRTGGAVSAPAPTGR